MPRLWARLRCAYFRERAMWARDGASFMKWRMRLQAERAKL